MTSLTMRGLNLIEAILRNRGYKVVRAAEEAGNVGPADPVPAMSRDAMLILTGGNADLVDASTSQLYQDIFVLSEHSYKQGGFFVEFGAADGVYLSNTQLLETRFGWTGLLAEPARKWHAPLAANRSCIIETDCVWSRTGEQLTFLETPDAHLSTLQGFEDSDSHADIRTGAIAYQVRTISLQDLLDRHQAPRTIDYLSLDTEGSEYDILAAFDFTAYDIRVITCEHNDTPDRERIHALLASKGYVRKYTGLSRWDDWYVRQ